MEREPQREPADSRAYDHDIHHALQRIPSSPRQAGIQAPFNPVLDSRLRGNDVLNRA